MISRTQTVHWSASSCTKA